MRIFLTGGTGLVGSHVAERCLEAGHDVRALVRPGSEASFLRDIGAEVYRGDITRRASLDGALSGCNALIHAAALVVSDARWGAYRRANVEGTLNVLQAAAFEGLRRAVHVSSVAVYGGAEAIGTGPIDESFPRDGELPSGEHYARSKREAEEVAWRFQREGRLELVVVRPDVIYGERDRAVIPRVVPFVDRPVSLLVGSGRRELPMVYAGNVADGILRALVCDGVGGRAYNLTTDFPITQRGFFELVARELGRTPRFLRVPYPLAYGAAAIAEALARLRGGATPTLSRRRIAFFGVGNPFVCERARTELGWTPQVGHREGVRRAVGFYLSNGPGSDRP